MSWLKRKYMQLKRYLTRDRNQLELPLPTEPQAGTVKETGPEQTMPRLTKSISSVGLALIIEFEGFYAEPYICPAGVITIGYGTIAYSDGRKVSMNDNPISKEAAAYELNHEVNEKCQKMIPFFEREGFAPTQNEFDALCSFAYNLGLGPIVNSNSTVSRGIRNNDRSTIVKGMLMYNKAGGRKLKGLVRRRKAEVALFKEQ